MTAMPSCCIGQSLGEFRKPPLNGPQMPGQFTIRFSAVP